MNGFDDDLFDYFVTPEFGILMYNILCCLYFINNKSKHIQLFDRETDVSSEAWSPPPGPIALDSEEEIMQIYLWIKSQKNYNGQNMLHVIYTI